MLVQENGAPFEMSYLPLSVRDPSAPARAAAAINFGTLRPGDWVVLEDAGDHPQNATIYRQDWEKLITALQLCPDLNILMMTMFDYPPAAPIYQYDTNFTGGTMNNATRQAAANKGVPLLDMNALMDNWRNAAASIDGVAVMHPDGIHPNVWGGCLMLGKVMSALNIKQYVFSVEMPWSKLAPHWQLTKYGSTTFTQNRAKQYLQHCLMG